MKRHLLQAAAAVGAVALLVPAAVIASPGSGVSGVTTRGDGVIDGPLKVETDGFIEIKASGDVRVFDQELTIAPGGNTGWHTHPGPVLVTVKSGIFRHQHEDCSYTDYPAGQTLIDEGGGHVHVGRNVSDVPMALSITFLAPRGVPLRTEADAVDC